MSAACTFLFGLSIQLGVEFWIYEVVLNENLRGAVADARPFPPLAALLLRGLHLNHSCVFSCDQAFSLRLFSFITRCGQRSTLQLRIASSDANGTVQASRATAARCSRGKTGTSRREAAPEMAGTGTTQADHQVFRSPGHLPGQMTSTPPIARGRLSAPCQPRVRP